MSIDRAQFGASSITDCDLFCAFVSQLLRKVRQFNRLDEFIPDLERTQSLAKYHNTYLVTASPETIYVKSSSPRFFPAETSVR